MPAQARSCASTIADIGRSDHHGRATSVSCCSGISSCGRLGPLPPHASRACGGAAYFAQIGQARLALGRALGGGQSRGLITVWLEVRVFPSPPRTLSNLGISRFAPKGPELAGGAVGAVISAETNSGMEEISAELPLALKSGCPVTETVSSRDAVRISDHYVLKPSIRC